MTSNDELAKLYDRIGKLLKSKFNLKEEPDWIDVLGIVDEMSKYPRKRWNDSLWLTNVKKHFKKTGGFKITEGLDLSDLNYYLDLILKKLNEE